MYVSDVSCICTNASRGLSAAADFLVSFSNTIYSFSIVCLEHHYREDQQRSLLTQNLYPPSAFVYLLRLGLKNLVLFTLLIVFK